MKENKQYHDCSDEHIKQGYKSLDDVAPPKKMTPREEQPVYAQIQEAI